MGKDRNIKADRRIRRLDEEGRALAAGATRDEIRANKKVINRAGISAHRKLRKEAEKRGESWRA